MSPLGKHVLAEVSSHWLLSQVRPPTHCFLCGPELRMVFTCLNGWGKVKRRETFFDRSNLHTIQNSTSLNESCGYTAILTL